MVLVVPPPDPPDMAENPGSLEARGPPLLNCVEALPEVPAPAVTAMLKTARATVGASRTIGRITPRLASRPLLDCLVAGPPVVSAWGASSSMASGGLSEPSTDPEKAALVATGLSG